MWGFVVVNGIRGEERKKKGRLKNIHGRTMLLHVIHVITTATATIKVETMQSGW